MAPERPSTRRASALVPVATAFCVGLVVRLVAVMAWSRRVQPHGDEAFYWRQAQSLGQGMGFVYRSNFGEQVPTAVHPPLYSAYLGVVGLLRLPEASHLPYRLATALLGAVAVGVIALVAHRLAGRRAAFLAGAIAAIYPNLWFNDAKLTAESMYALTVGVVLLAAHRFHREPGPKAAAWLGAVLAMAALARAEALLFFPLVLVPLALLARSRPIGARVKLAAIGLAAGVVVLLPWLARNTTSFQHPATISTGSGFVIEISSCDQTFGLAPPMGPGEVATGQPPDEYLGYWTPACDRSDARIHGAAAVPWPAGDETAIEQWKRGIGLDYVGSHTRQLPAVLLARIGRIWDVWRPGQSIQLNSFFEGRDAETSIGSLTIHWQTVAMGEHFALLALGVIGLTALRRRHHTLLPYAALAFSATFTAALSFGITRYRVGADVALCVLGGVAVDALWRRWRPAPVEGR